MRYLGPVLRRAGLMLLNMLMLVGLVLAFSTMPIPMVRTAPGHFLGIQVRMNMALWGHDLAEYIHLVAAGTLGKDQHGRLVSSLLAERLGQSLLLLGAAFALALFFGTLKGVADFRQQRRRHLALGPVLTSAVEGLPDFVLIFGVQWLGVLAYRWIVGHPGMMEAVGGMPVPVVYSADMPVRSFLLPALCLTLIPWSYVARTVNRAMQEVWTQDYIRAAHAKGLRETVVIYRHALRNAIIPLLDDLPNLLTITLSNLLVVEYLFNYPGFTTLVQEAIKPYAVLPSSRSSVGVTYHSHDTPPLVAAGVAIGLVLSVTYLVITLVRYWADPRLKEGVDR